MKNDLTLMHLDVDHKSFQIDAFPCKRIIIIQGISYPMLKVSQFQNVFLVSSFGQKTNEKITRISVLAYIGQKFW